MQKFKPLILNQNTPSAQQTAPAGIWEFEKYRITKDTPITYNQAIISCNGEAVIKPGNICLLAGKQKAGKSHAVICMVSAAIKNKEILGFCGTGLADNEVTIYIDTEQADEQCKDNVLKIHALTELAELNNYYYCLSELMPDEIKDFIDQLLINFIEVHKKKVRLLVIDGIADLLTKGNNDEEGSKRIAHWSKVIASKYNMGVILVLHENSKGGSEGKTAGHIGTYLEKKSYSYLSISYNKDENCHEIKCTHSRQKIKDVFGTIQFKYNKETHLPELVQHIKQIELWPSAQEQLRDRLDRIAKYITDGLSANEIMRKENISQPTFSRLKKQIED